MQHTRAEMYVLKKSFGSQSSIVSTLEAFVIAAAQEGYHSSCCRGIAALKGIIPGPRSAKSLKQEKKQDLLFPSSTSPNCTALTYCSRTCLSSSGLALSCLPEGEYRAALAGEGSEQASSLFNMFLQGVQHEWVPFPYQMHAHLWLSHFPHLPDHCTSVTTTWTNGSRASRPCSTAHCQAR